MFERFTERSRQVVVLAQNEAKTMQHDNIGTEHLLLGLVLEEEGLGAKALRELGLRLDTARDQVEALHANSATSTMAQAGTSVPFTAHAKKALELALREALALGHNYIGTEHVLLGLIKEPNTKARQILDQNNIKVEDIRNTVVGLLAGAQRGGTQNRAVRRTKAKMLEQFGRNMTEMAREGKLDPVIGRQVEVDRLMQILTRRTKNNPILLGDAGVGKTAVVEGLAQRMARGEVPAMLKDFELYTLDLGGLVAGSKYRGEFEERIKKIIKEVQDAGNILLFFDEIHSMIGAGAAEGAIDAASILKPALARGELRVIGATTQKEYRRFFAKDAAMERRFQPVEVGEPTAEEATLILQGLKDRYEEHHGVHFTQDAIEAAVTLSKRYISDRKLPDKAIDLIDEAGSRLRLATLKKDDAPDGELDPDLVALRNDKVAAAKAEDYERAGRLREQERALLTELGLDPNVDPLRPSVTSEDIAEIVSMWTGVPVTSLSEIESEKLMNLEHELRKRVIGQRDAIHAIGRSIRRSRSGISDPKRPQGSFLFLGPTGVGKTELSKAVADYLFGAEDKMIRFDMSEYMEKHTISRLIGSPPGYVGYNEGGQLSEAIKRNPYSVVLFDEIEKAHPDIYNILLQMLEDGQLTDSQGRKIDCRNTIIIMTSNIGSSQITGKKSIGFSADNDDVMSNTDIRSKVMGELKNHFRPELLNRIDETIVFHSLTLDELNPIVDLMLGRLGNQLRDKKLGFTITAAMREKLLVDGHEPAYGARPMRRAIQRLIEDPLADYILEENPAEKSMLVVDYDAEKGSSVRLEQKALVAQTS